MRTATELRKARYEFPWNGPLLDLCDEAIAALEEKEREAVLLCKELEELKLKTILLGGQDCKVVTLPAPTPEVPECRHLFEHDGRFTAPTWRCIRCGYTTPWVELYQGSSASAGPEGQPR